MSLDRFVRCEFDQQYNTALYRHTNDVCSRVTLERLLVCCLLMFTFLVMTDYIQDLPYVVCTILF